MRISDWSSDVCSSDLPFRCVREGGLEPPRPIRALAPQASASTYSATRAWVSRLRKRRSRLARRRRPPIITSVAAGRDETGTTHPPGSVGDQDQRSTDLPELLPNHAAPHRLKTSKKKQN